MKLGVVVPAGTPSDLVALACAVEEAGLDLLWLRLPAWPVPLLAASALAGRTSTLRIVAEVPLGDVHPLHVAEDVVVADLALGGRLGLAVRPASSVEDEVFAEAVALLLHALAPAPFRFMGRRWRVPANLAANTVGVEERLRVTPATAQLELPVWVAGAPTVARDLGLAAVAQPDDRGSARAPVGRRRPALRAAVVGDAGLDVEATTELLRADQRDWGLDVAALDLGLDHGEPLHTAVRDLGARVWPRLQIDRLPPGLTAHWDNLA
jgi:alkanesulfonate monooxygenase SsuD/methylene tetrahydromethanopterin reductase-like flavin-dependent oxidoreductase (luciferase family)